MNLHLTWLDRLMIRVTYAEHGIDITSAMDKARHTSVFPSSAGGNSINRNTGLVEPLPAQT